MSITYSYDIFDTILTRKTANPEGIFSLMQNKLKNLGNYYPVEVRKNFFELRIQSERLARKFYCRDEKEDITLLQIYHAMNTTGLLSENMIESLMKLEFETELENVIPILPIVSEIQEHLNRNESVIFISDMYLGKKEISKMLEVASKEWGKIPIFISSEIGKTKASGNMFRFIQRELQISFNNWIHIGDNIYSDIHIPNQMGIKTVLVKDELLNSLERAMLSGKEQDISTQLLIGISKNTRKLYHLDSVQTVGATLSGILLGAYAKYILHDALRRGIKTLYFIARDGYVIKKIVDIFIQSKKYPISTKYIYGSRRAWKIPACNWEEVDFVSLMSTSSQFICDLRECADILGISYLEFKNFLPQNVIENSHKLSGLDMSLLFRYLNASKEFRKYLAKTHKENRKMVLAYLEQEIDLQEDQVAFVEVGGTGYTQKSLETILRDVYNGKISTYFFQLYSLNEKENSIFYNFIPDNLYIKDAIEPLCRAPHGQTLGYKCVNNHIEPVLEELEDKSFFECVYSKYIYGLSMYAEVYMDYYREYFEFPINRNIISKCWDYYTSIRDEGILNFVGEVPFEVAGSDKSGYTYAPKLSEQEIKEIFCDFKDSPIAWHYRGASINVSILRMSESEKHLMETYRYLEKKEIKYEEELEKDYYSTAFIRIPKNKYPIGSRIVLYGAGKVGRIFYRQIIEEQEYTAILWVDKQFIKYEKKGYPVLSPDRLRGVEYDIILIAVLDEKVYRDIKKDLIKMEVEEKKIDWISQKELIKGEVERG